MKQVNNPEHGVFSVIDLLRQEETHGIVLGHRCGVAQRKETLDRLATLVGRRSGVEECLKSGGPRIERRSNAVSIPEYMPLGRL